jgi:hypothetical protein
MALIQSLGEAMSWFEREGAWDRASHVIFNAHTLDEVDPHHHPASQHRGAGNEILLDAHKDKGEELMRPGIGVKDLFHQAVQAWSRQDGFRDQTWWLHDTRASPPL